MLIRTISNNCEPQIDYFGKNGHSILSCLEILLVIFHKIFNFSYDIQYISKVRRNSEGERLLDNGYRLCVSCIFCLVQKQISRNYLVYKQESFFRIVSSTFSSHSSYQVSNIRAPAPLNSAYQLIKIEVVKNVIVLRNYSCHFCFFSGTKGLTFFF